MAGAVNLAFGEFELDAERLELRRNGTLVELQPTPLRVLLYLAEHRDRTVSPRELLDRLWPDTTVTDTALANAVNQARHAVDDDGTAQRVIRTFKGHGYRFVAEVGSDPATPGIAALRRRRVVWMGALATAVLGLGVWQLAAVEGLWTVRSDPMPGPPLTAIAVMPFDDLSPDGDHEWLANGMAVELIDALSRIEDFRVSGRTSTAVLRRERASIATISSQLNVGSVVEGSIRISGDDLRVTAQLVNGAGAHMWSASYDRNLEDILDVQSEIAHQVAEAIRTQLGAEEPYSWAGRGRYAAEDVRAYRQVRRASNLLFEGGMYGLTEGNARRAVDYVEQAIEIEPSYVTAHEARANIYFLIWLYWDRRQETFDRAKASAEHALELNDTSAGGHYALGSLCYFQYDWECALRHYDRALKLAPRNGPHQQSHAELLMDMGRIEEAIPYMRRAAELDPRALNGWAMLGLLDTLMGDHDSAIEDYELAFELTPHAISAFWLGPAIAYREKGMDEEAVEAAMRGNPSAESDLRAGYEQGGWTGLLQAALETTVRRDESACTAMGSTGGTAHFLYALLGHEVEMFECLEALDGLSGFRTAFGPADVPGNPFRPYHDDPRWHRLLRQWNLEE